MGGRSQGNKVSLGRILIEVRGQLARAWPVSMAVFTASFAVAQIALAA